jgi:hypothetical protein
MVYYRTERDPGTLAGLTVPSQSNKQQEESLPDLVYSLLFFYHKI